MTLQHLIGCLLLLMLGACTGGIPTMDLGVGVSGTVTDSVSGRPIEGATVTSQNKSAGTDANGRYGIGSLRPGTSLVRVTHAAYRDAERQVAINSFMSPGDFVLEPR